MNQYLAEQHLPGNIEIHEYLKLAGVDRDKASRDWDAAVYDVFREMDEPGRHLGNLSPYIASNQYDIVLKELNIRRDCRRQANIKSCGMNKDDIIKMTNKDGMGLLHQMVVSDKTNDVKLIKHQEQVLVLLLQEGFDPFEKLGSKGGNAFTLSLEYQHPHMFKVLIKRALFRVEGGRLQNIIDVSGDDLSHLAAKYLPLNSKIQVWLNLAGLEGDTLNSDNLTAKQIRKIYLKSLNNEL